MVDVFPTGDMYDTMKTTIEKQRTADPSDGGISMKSRVGRKSASNKVRLPPLKDAPKIPSPPGGSKSLKKLKKVIPDTKAKIEDDTVDGLLNQEADNSVL